MSSTRIGAEGSHTRSSAWIGVVTAVASCVFGFAASMFWFACALGLVSLGFGIYALLTARNQGVRIGLPRVATTLATLAVVLLAIRVLLPPAAARDLVEWWENEVLSDQCEDSESFTAGNLECPPPTRE